MTQQPADLYSMLVTYAARIRSPFVDGRRFFLFFNRQSGARLLRTQAAMSRWQMEQRARLQLGLDALVRDGKCVCSSDDAGNQTIFLPQFCRTWLKQCYDTIAENGEPPFPSEMTLRREIPRDLVLNVEVESGLAGYLDNPPATGGEIVRLLFPGSLGSILILAEMMPQGLIEAALYKLRFYLQNADTKEYTYQKVSPQFRDKEAYLRGAMNEIVLRPLECVNMLAGGEDLPYVFWAALCVVVKKDFQEKAERLGEDLADIPILQAICLIETVNFYYRNAAAKRRVKEQALASLDAKLNKPPYLYSLDDISQFTGPDNGTPLLDLCTLKELETWLRGKTTESPDNRLPELLVVQGADKEWLYSPKSKILLVCARLLSETRDKLKDAVTKRWAGILMEYDREKAMDADADFDRLLLRQVRKINPVLASLLDDPKLRLVYDELEGSQGGIPAVSRIFSKGALIPYSSLFLLRRKDLLEDARSSLPLRYTLPIISTITAFLKNLFRARKPAPPVVADDAPDAAAGTADPRETAIRRLEDTMIPEGLGADAFMEKLADRWLPIADKASRTGLLRDVNNLVRDRFAQSQKMRMNRVPTHEDLTEIAVNIAQGHPSLRDLSNRSALEKYIEVYIIKLLRLSRS